MTRTAKAPQAREETRWAMRAASCGESVVVLGIHDGHNAGAALVKDGRVVGAIGEERLTNQKNFSGVPARAIRRVFEIAEVMPDEVRMVAVGCLLRLSRPVDDEYSPSNVLRRKLVRFTGKKPIASRLVRVAHHLRRTEDLRRALANVGLERCPISFVEHHLTHAACAYYSRPWEEETLVLTLDGSGDGVSSTVSVGRGHKIERIAWSSFFDSVGNNLYSEVTAHLGMRPWEDECKVMGMAPYGCADSCIDILRGVVRINPRRPLEFQNTIGVYSVDLRKKLNRLLAGQTFENVSAACQQLCEELIVRWVRNAIRETGIHRVACAGGMFLNVKANKLIRELPDVESAFFYPASDDGGTPVGAAVEAYHRICEDNGLPTTRERLGAIYYGYTWSDEEAEEAIRRHGFWDRAEKGEAINERVAEEVASGKIVARFSGGDEWGPRALGNRTIVADARHVDVIQRINSAVKQRESWMPFAAAVLEERVGDYLLQGRPARFMIEAFDATPEAKDIVAGLHPIDHTCRPQTVADYNPGWLAVLKEFERRTGSGGVLNTSFNLHGYPTCGSPEVALATLESSQLDALAIGSWWVRRR